MIVTVAVSCEVSREATVVSEYSSSRTVKVSGPSATASSTVATEIWFEAEALRAIVQVRPAVSGGV